METIHTFQGKDSITGPLVRHNVPSGARQIHRGEGVEGRQDLPRDSSQDYEAVARGTLESMQPPPPQVTRSEPRERSAQFHLQKGWISAALPTDKYTKFHKRAQESRSFVLPNKTDDGYVSIFLQHHGNHCLLTPLDQCAHPHCCRSAAPDVSLVAPDCDSRACLARSRHADIPARYRRMGQMTVPSLTLTHYTEFQESHDIVLMSAANVIDPRNCAALPLACRPTMNQSLARWRVRLAAVARALSCFGRPLLTVLSCHCALPALNMRGEPSGTDLTPMQGRVLSTLMHLFWLNDEKYAKHVHCFNHRQRDFHWNQVVNEVIGIAQQKVKTMTQDAEDGAFTFEGLKSRNLT